jgi:SagB-type dehydrogenase family enzyme
MTRASHPQPTQSDAITLPEPRRDGERSLEHVLGRRRSVRVFAADAPSLAAIGQLAWAAQGIAEPERGLRTAPSAGATYPLEIDLVVHATPDLPDGTYRYLPAGHALLLRTAGDRRAAVQQAALDQAAVGAAPLIIAMSAVMERTAERYGDRAERYVAMEAGHAAQNVCLQAVSLGFDSVAIGAFDDDALARALASPPGERPLYLVAVGRRP